MGFTEVAAVIDKVHGVSPAQKLVLIALADRADKTGTCWPSVREIARRAEISRRSTFRQVRALEKIGLLATQARSMRTKGGWRRTSNLYRLNLPAIMAGRFDTQAADQAEGESIHRSVHSFGEVVHNQGDVIHTSDVEGVDNFSGDSEQSTGLSTIPSSQGVDPRVNLTPPPCQPDTTPRVNLTPPPCQPDTTPRVTVTPHEPPKGNQPPQPSPQPPSPSAHENSAECDPQAAARRRADGRAAREGARRGEGEETSSDSPGAVPPPSAGGTGPASADGSQGVPGAGAGTDEADRDADSPDGPSWPDMPDEPYPDGPWWDPGWPDLSVDVSQFVDDDHLDPEIIAAIVESLTQANRWADERAGGQRPPLGSHRPASGGETTRRGDASTGPGKPASGKHSAPQGPSTGDNRPETGGDAETVPAPEPSPADDRALIDDCLPEDMRARVPARDRGKIAAALRERTSAGWSPRAVRGVLAGRAVPEQTRSMTGLILARLRDDVDPADPPREVARNADGSRLRYDSAGQVVNRNDVDTCLLARGHRAAVAGGETLGRWAWAEKVGLERFLIGATDPWVVGG